jgi:hypothetical protein
MQLDRSTHWNRDSRRRYLPWRYAKQQIHDREHGAAITTLGWRPDHRKRSPSATRPSRKVLLELSVEALLRH